MLFAEHAFISNDMLLINVVFDSDASASTLDRLDLLSNQMADISNDVKSLKEGVDCISIDVKDLRDTALDTSDGVNTLLSAQSSRLFAHQSWICLF